MGEKYRNWAWNHLQNRVKEKNNQLIMSDFSDFLHKKLFYLKNYL